MATLKKNTKPTSSKKPMRDLKTSKDVKGGARRVAVQGEERTRGNARVR